MFTSTKYSVFCPYSEKDILTKLLTQLMKTNIPLIIPVNMQLCLFIHFIFISFINWYAWYATFK